MCTLASGNSLVIQQRRLLFQGHEVYMSTQATVGMHYGYRSQQGQSNKPA